MQGLCLLLGGPSLPALPPLPSVPPRPSQTAPPETTASAAGAAPPALQPLGLAKGRDVPTLAHLIPSRHTSYHPGTPQPSWHTVHHPSTPRTIPAHHNRPGNREQPRHTTYYPSTLCTIPAHHNHAGTPHAIPAHHAPCQHTTLLPATCHQLPPRRGSISCSPSAAALTNHLTVCHRLNLAPALSARLINPIPEPPEGAAFQTGTCHRSAVPPLLLVMTPSCRRRGPQGPPPLQGRWDGWRVPCGRAGGSGGARLVPGSAPSVGREIYGRWEAPLPSCRRHDPPVTPGLKPGIITPSAKTKLPVEERLPEGLVGQGGRAAP